MVATSEVSVSLTLDPAQFGRAIPEETYQNAVNKLKEFSEITTKSEMCLVSIIGNTDHSAEVIGRAGLKLSQAGI